MPTTEDCVKQDYMWLARLSLYVGTWVLIVVVSHDQLCSGETGSLNRKWDQLPEVNQKSYQI